MQTIQDIKLEIELAKKDKFVHQINSWRENYKQGKIGKRYASKDNRIDKITDDFIYDFINAIRYATIILKEETPIQSYIGLVAYLMNTSNEDDIRTIAEMICASKDIEYKIIKSKSIIVKRIDNNLDILHLINQHKKYYPTPEVLIPDFPKQNCILGNPKNNHNLKLSRKTIDYLASIPLNLIEEIVKYPQQPKADWDDDTLNNFNISQVISREIYDDYLNKTFYFNWKFDKRGRMYPCGYDINPQGDEYHKASIEFAKKKKLNTRGLYWLKVSIANHYGFDKLSFKTRISKARNIIRTYLPILDDPDNYLWKEADKPLLLKQALLDYKKGVIDKEPVGYICHLDSTNSGVQLMSLIARDEKVMDLTNSLSSKFEDYYSVISNIIYEQTKTNKIWQGEYEGKSLTFPQTRRKALKKIIMTYWYNSQANPKNFFTDKTSLNIFYNVMQTQTKGASDIKDTINSSWNSESSINQWALPDNHTAYCPIYVHKIKRIELKEIDANINYMFEEIGIDNSQFKSLSPNIIHSLDAYLARLVVNAFRFKNLQIIPIHDSFGVHPNDCDYLRQIYRNILAIFYKDGEDILNNILSQINPEYSKFKAEPFKEEIYQAIKQNLDGYYIC